MPPNDGDVTHIEYLVIKPLYIFAKHMSVPYFSSFYVINSDIFIRIILISGTQTSNGCYYTEMKQDLP